MSLATSDGVCQAINESLSASADCGHLIARRFKSSVVCIECGLAVDDGCPFPRDGKYSIRDLRAITQVEVKEGIVPSHVHEQISKSLGPHKHLQSLHTDFKTETCILRSEKHKFEGWIADSSAIMTDCEMQHKKKPYQDPYRNLGHKYRPM